MPAQLELKRPSAQLQGAFVVGFFHLALFAALMTGLRTKPVPPIAEAPSVVLVRDVSRPEKPVKAPQPNPKLPAQITDARLPQISIPIADPSSAGLPDLATAPGADPLSGNASSVGSIGESSNAHSLNGNCTNVQQVGAETLFPERARKLGVTHGDAQVSFSVSTSGEVVIEGVTASNRAFESTAIDVAHRLKCASGRYVFPLEFSLSP